MKIKLRDVLDLNITLKRIIDNNDLNIDWNNEIKIIMNYSIYYFNKVCRHWAINRINVRSFSYFMCQFICIK